MSDYLLLTQFNAVRATPHWLPVPIRKQHPVILRCRRPILLQRQRCEYSPGLRDGVRRCCAHVRQEQGQRFAQRRCPQWSKRSVGPNFSSPDPAIATVWRWWSRYRRALGPVRRPGMDWRHSLPGAVHLPGCQSMVQPVLVKCLRRSTLDGCLLYEEDWILELRVLHI